MTAPAASTITRRGRYYIDTVNGGRYPSVTTVIDAALAKPALTGWYATQTAGRAVDQLAELSRRVRLDGPESAAAWLARAPRDTSHAAAVRGSDLHDLAERHAHGEEPPADLAHDVKAMLGQYERFRADWRPTIAHTEMTVLNRTMGYGGTADAVMSLPAYAGLPLITDYKTGRTGPHAEWAVQLAAYANGECVLKRTGDKRTKIVEEIMPAVDISRALILRIRPDTYELHEADLTGLLDVFAAMLKVHSFATSAEPFTERRPATESATYWTNRIDTARTVDDLHTIWVDAVAASQWDDRLLNHCATRKAQLLGGQT
ncbi:hypothetical protein [Actinomadura sp. NEAU-AAG7]|uniref:hypothetical protein n=1 Tax=Actinomadura sp. NEAU-AAG7 TaxID=2839640 RepID=UPI001BE49C5D|nr:hypothetical protein [Actinomadura sp. NEAU-AAG7]MBT2213482.1 hypothetical protein [Actinomadura sp. NEAU-AAG7]